MMEAGRVGGDSTMGLPDVMEISKTDFGRV